MPQRTFIIGIGSELPNSGVATLCCQLQALLKAVDITCTIIETRGAATRTLVQGGAKSEDDSPEADDRHRSILYRPTASTHGAASAHDFDWRTLDGLTGQLALVALPPFSETGSADPRRWMDHCDRLLWVTTAQASPRLRLESLQHLLDESAQLPPTGVIANMVTGSHQGKRLMGQVRDAFALRGANEPIDLGHLSYETSVAIATGRASTVGHCFPDSPAMEELQRIADRTLKFLADPSTDTEQHDVPAAIPASGTQPGVTDAPPRATKGEPGPGLGAETEAGIAAEVLRLRSTYAQNPELLVQIASALLEAPAQNPQPAATQSALAAADRGRRERQPSTPNADRPPTNSLRQHSSAPGLPRTDWRQLMELAARTGAR